MTATPGPGQFVGHLTPEIQACAARNKALTATLSRQHERFVANIAEVERAFDAWGERLAEKRHV